MSRIGEDDLEASFPSDRNDVAKLANDLNPDIAQDNSLEVLGDRQLRTTASPEATAGTTAAGETGGADSANDTQTSGSTLALTTTAPVDSDSTISDAVSTTKGSSNNWVVDKAKEVGISYTILLGIALGLIILNIILVVAVMCLCRSRPIAADGPKTASDQEREKKRNARLMNDFDISYPSEDEGGHHKKKKKDKKKGKKKGKKDKKKKKKKKKH